MAHLVFPAKLYELFDVHDASVAAARCSYVNVVLEFAPAMPHSPQCHELVAEGAIGNAAGLTCGL